MNTESGEHHNIVQRLRKYMKQLQDGISVEVIQPNFDLVSLIALLLRIFGQLTKIY